MSIWPAGCAEITLCRDLRSTPFPTLCPTTRRTAWLRGDYALPGPAIDPLSDPVPDHPEDRAPDAENAERKTRLQ